MKINKFVLIAVVFFFFNSVGLPYGLTYMTLLTPMFYWWILRKTRSEPVIPFLALLIPFLVIQLINRPDIGVLAISLANMICIYVFCRAFYLFEKTAPEPLVEKIFDSLLYMNFYLCLVAIPLYFTPYYNLFWIDQFLTQGINEYRRFRMFTYEASYYAFLFMPLFFFYLMQMWLKMNKKPVRLLLLMISLPLVLSFSLGVISAMLIAVFFTGLLHYKKLVKNQRILQFILGGLSLLFLGLIFSAIFFPNNTLVTRIGNIFSGNDSSAKGRTFDAFYLAEKIISLKSYLFGIGPGQLKLIGAPIIREYYNYPPEYAITIPNAVAETLVVFGWLGLFIRLALEIGLFFGTAVWKNYYRLVLFIFVFIYQFTGSFITNVAEYLIWIIVFSRAFPSFNVNVRSNMNERFNERGQR